MSDNISRPTTVAITPAGKHTLVSKFIVLAAEAKGNYFQAAELAQERCPALTVLPKIFRAKGNVGALTGSDNPYGFNESVPLALLVDELRQLLAAFSRVDFRTKTPEENQAGGAGSWIGEGLPAPNYKSTLATITLDYFKSIVIAVVTRELAKHGKATEATLLRVLRNLISRFIATQLFDPSVAATSAHPASLTRGCNSVTSTGSSASQITTDLSAMIAAIQSPGSDLRWIMRPLTFFMICAKLGGAGLNVSKDDLFGIPVVLLSGGPRQITLLDCAAVLYASDDEMSLDISTEASIEMSDAPSESGISGGGAQQVSLYQSGLIGLKAEMAMSWQHAFTSYSSPTVPQGCVYMTVSF